ncbi:DoxX family protein [Muricauda sp. MAR_2010_75]|uniref:DoxX family protein n=1 Tax=Allomuricauda sp. MAR_2010_75 TaxID=1250232 RepID=UPI0018CEFC40|nr:DoxX family protein [Muricauda sp. MAR_2010_75]
MAISIGLVYLWFGMLKFFPDLSPAEGLAKSTIHVLTFGLIPDNVSIILLALWETGIGIFLIFNVARKTVTMFALVHIVFTFTPLMFFPDQVFNEGPLYLTLLGQYIIKNLIIIAALLSLLNVDSRAFSFKTKISFKQQFPLFMRTFKFSPADDGTTQKHPDQG